MSGPAIKILVVDDEPPIRKLLRMGFDLGLPGRNGLELLQDLRGAGIDVPVVVLSSRTDEAGIVEALERGADDYVTKPFSMNELIARIKVALRHRLQEQGEKPIFKVGDLSVDLVRRVVRSGEKEIKLSPREYDILRTLVRHAGRVLTHQALLREVWGGIADVQNLRVHVRQLRRKIEPDPELPRYILTETGVGYRRSETRTEPFAIGVMACRRDGHGARTLDAADPILVEAQAADGGAQRSTEMNAPLAPIEAGAAEGPARAPAARRQHRCGVHADPVQKPQAALGDEAAFLGELGMAIGNQGIGQGDAETAGQMIVANACCAQGVVPRSDDQPPGRWLLVRCHLHDRFHHPGDGRRGQPVVAVASLLHDADEIDRGQAGEVTARRLRRHAGDGGKLRGGQRSAAQ